MENVERAEERFIGSGLIYAMEEANAFSVADTVPSIKSVTWLTWHTTRELDFQIADLAKTRQSGSLRLEEKVCLGFAGDGKINHTPQAHKVVVTDIEVAQDYLSDAVCSNNYIY